VHDHQCAGAETNTPLNVLGRTTERHARVGYRADYFLNHSKMFGCQSTELLSLEQTSILLALSR
jgi:hypothetical protein